MYALIGFAAKLSHIAVTHNSIQSILQNGTSVTNLVAFVTIRRLVLLQTWDEFMHICIIHHYISSNKRQKSGSPELQQG